MAPLPSRIPDGVAALCDADPSVPLRVGLDGPQRQWQCVSGDSLRTYAGLEGILGEPVERSLAE